jgi:serine/threonine protein kinase/formylglycine-generating enzyme required for sulfatase activity
MTSPHPSSSPDNQLVVSLFHRAASLPQADRAAFLRREAGGDQALERRVLELLAAEARGDTDGLRALLGTVLGSPEDSPAGGGDKVQSTATGELLERLKTAPKLDGDRFVVESELGQGGMGLVMRIHDRYLNRRLAMKVLLERRQPQDAEEQRLAHQMLGRFLEEAQVTSQLDHPGVVPVHELGLDSQGKVYFTMRMVKGRTASEVFLDCQADSGEWSLTRGLEVILKVCDTMAYAHDKGVLHRDLKPGNVMVGRFGEVYVMDWGLAKVLGQADRHDLRIRKDAGTGVSVIDSTRLRDAAEDSANSVVTMDGQQLGTPSYMSPEQARSEELDVRADVYSIGAMMYELVAGRAPYVAPGMRKPAYRILEDLNEGPPKRVEEIKKGVPAELVAVIEKAMARDREQRYRTVLELAADVRAFLAQRVVSAYRTGALEETKLWVRRNKPLAASLAAAALLLVGGIAVAVTFGAAEAKARQIADAKVAEFNQLALVVDYEKLVEEEGRLGPGYPDQRDAILDWLRRAESLLAQKESLATVIASVQQAEAAATEKDAAPAAARFLATSLTDLLGKLPKLEGLVPEMQRRKLWSEVVGPATLSHPKARVSWADARKAVATSPKYAGQDIPLRDRDVWGLVPIGENPQSGLWEFYDLRSAWDGSGDIGSLEIPQQDAAGRIQVTGATGIVWVLLPGGTLPAGTEDEGSEGPSVRLGVRLDPFFLSKYEATQGQWLRWTGNNPSYSKDRNELSLPVETVNWYTSTATLAKFGLVLPSELQWEYGIRGGKSTRWWTGDEEKAIVAAENIRGDTLLSVGSKTANPFGLFDMGGNLWEWCWDEYGDYGTERAGDGRRPDPVDGPLLRCLRGGAWGNDPGYAQSGNRNDDDAAFRYNFLGLRPARTSRR